MKNKKDLVKEYSNGEITVVWKPEKCIHSTLCWHGLPKVFNPKARPWIDAQAASSAHIIEQVKKCPSAALSYYYNDKREDVTNKSTTSTETTVEMMPNGPLLVTGNLRIVKKDGSIDIAMEQTAFCRCGGTKNHPYCDGTHEKINYKG
jgi:Uncharacterized conserved protein